jgi:hypothetical protein
MPAGSKESYIRPPGAPKAPHSKLFYGGFPYYTTIFPQPRMALKAGKIWYKWSGSQVPGIGIYQHVSTCAQETDTSWAS